MMAFLIRRFSLARREEQRLAGEFEAARTVQSLLIPAASPATPGFKVESVYLPAAEVGGDFFQVLPGTDGSLLAIVGDVSGKGLKAAMTVSSIVGALRDNKVRQPTQVLAHLNRVLCGQVSGFVTCCATLIAKDGAMTVANAGHLPPYWNGEELSLPAALPLGLVAEAQYETTALHLMPGDLLTLLSDGVVEAQSPTGELFGFDRTAAISTQPAEAIAHAAQQFGQEDDITVLTLRYAPA
jgi:serine phosphatase RsbU (regulator of sigma subunit)